jgi:methionine synthase II (cobalamin-independent)
LYSLGLLFQFTTFSAGSLAVYSVFAKRRSRPGSAFVNVSRDEVIAAIDLAVAGIHQEGALAGLHCCGNTDWSLVTSTAVDVINLDAHDYFQGLSCYPDDLHAFLERGGVLSFGIVPTTHSIEEISASDLMKKLSGYAEVLESKGIDRQTLYRQSLLTPSCGMGTLSIKHAERVVQLLVELATMIQRAQGF